MNTGTTDRELLLRIRRGDASGLGVVLDRYWTQLVGYVATMGVDWDTAEDVAQQVFVRLWERRTALKAEGSLRGLLYRIARNRCIDVRRRRATRERAARNAIREQPGALPLDNVVGRELWTNLRHAVNNLPKRRREVFLLVRHYGLSHREAAEALDLAPQTVANHLSMALTYLRGRLAPHLAGSYREAATGSSLHGVGRSAQLGRR